jgi:hypothetical protein
LVVAAGAPKENGAGEAVTAGVAAAGCPKGFGGAAVSTGFDAPNWILDPIRTYQEMTYE